MLRQENATLKGKGSNIEVVRPSESESDSKGNGNENDIPEASMSQLLGIMQSMNEQISKLAHVVNNDGKDVKKLRHRRRRGDEHKEESSEDDEDDVDGMDFNMRRAQNPKTHLRADLREYLLSKVLTTE